MVKEFALRGKLFVVGEQKDRPETTMCSIPGRRGDPVNIY
jgi:hypothetical protein